MAFKKQWHTIKRLWTPAAQPFTIGSWYDCSDTSSFTYGTGNDVQVMADQWGNNDISAFVSSPEANTRSLNGLNVLDFTSPDRMQIAGLDPGTSGDHIGIGLFEIDFINNANQTIWSMNHVGIYDYQMDANNANYFNGELNNWGTNIAAVGENAGPSIFCCVWNYTTGVKEFWLDGSLVGSASDYTADKIGNPLELGLMVNRGYNQYLDGMCAEFLWGEDDVSDSYRQKVEGYMSHKWALTTNLPAGHPYKNKPPTT